MTRISRGAVAVLAAGLAASGLWSLSRPGTAQAGISGEQLRLFIRDSDQQALDLGPKGESAGDVFVFHGLLYDRKGGKQLGRFGGTCTTLPKAGPTPSDVDCYLDAVLPDGQLFLRGYDTAARLFGGKLSDVGIVGGTGAYRLARGAGTVRVPVNVKDQTDAYFVLNVVR